jgi:hypothetical protein
MVADVTAPGTGVGFSEKADVDFLITREGRNWLVYETISGERRATGRTLADALRAFAKPLGLTGQIELRWEYQADRLQLIDI